MAGSVTTEEKVEQLKQDSGVQKALDQAATPKEAVIVPAESKRRLFLGTYSVVLLVLSACYYLLRLRLFRVGEAYLPLLQRLLLGTIAIVVAVGLAKVVDYYFISRLTDSVSQYNTRRIVKLIDALVVTFIL